MRISDWSSDVCSSDLDGGQDHQTGHPRLPARAAASGEPDVPRALAGRRSGDRRVPALVPHAELGLPGGSGMRPGGGGGLLSAAATWVAPAPALTQLGRSSCRERVCQYVLFSVVAVSLKKKKMQIVCLSDA